MLVNTASLKVERWEINSDPADRKTHSSISRFLNPTDPPSPLLFPLAFLDRIRQFIRLALPIQSSENCRTRNRISPSMDENATGPGDGTSVQSEFSDMYVSLWTYWRKNRCTWKETFNELFNGALPGEKIHKVFNCCLWVPVGPITGTLFLTTKRIAFCSESTIANYLKVTVPLEQLKSVTSSACTTSDSSEKFIDIDGSEGNVYRFKYFELYDEALQSLKEVLQSPLPK